MKKRMLSTLLALCLLAGLLPTTARAVSALEITQQPAAENNYTVMATYMGQKMDQGFQWYKKVDTATAYTLVQENPQTGELAVDEVIYGSYTDEHWAAEDENAPISVSFLSSPNDEITVTVLSGGDAPEGNNGDIQFTEVSSGVYTATSTGGMLQIYIDNSERTAAVTATITVKRCWTPVAGQISASLTASGSGTYYCAVTGQDPDRGFFGAITNTVTILSQEEQATADWLTDSAHRLTLGPTTVTADNAKDILGDGKASFALVDGMPTLTLDGVNVTEGIAESGGTIGLTCSDALTIVLAEGSDNTITLTDYMPMGIVIGTPDDDSASTVFLTVTGKGTLTVDVTGSSSICMGVSTRYGVQVTGGAELTATASVSAVSQCFGLFIQEEDLQVSDGGVVRLSGTGAAAAFGDAASQIPPEEGYSIRGSTAANDFDSLTDARRGEHPGFPTIVIGEEIAKSVLIAPAEPAHSHPVCGAACSHDGAHGNVTWQKLTKSDFSNRTNGVTYSSDTYTLAAGSYYLAEDIQIDAVLRVTTGTTVNLCLNGHKISNMWNAPNSFLNVYGALTLCSCVAGGEVSTTYATVCINTCRNDATADLYDVKVTGKLVGISNSGTLTVSGGEVINGISNSGTSSAKLILIGSPTIHDDTAALELKTTDGATLENAAVDATKYTGGTLNVKEYVPSWEEMSDRIGAYAIKVSDESKDKFTLTNQCYKYEYENGGMVIRGNHTGGTATCTAKAVCDVCGQEYGDLAAHTWGETYENDASQHWKKCTVCQTEDTKAAHTPSDWIIDQAATVEEAGSKHKECTVCHYTTATETIPKLEQPDPGPDPTYSISGTVTDSNNAVVNGVTVKLMQGNTEVARTTTSNGEYRFSGVKVGTYNVVATKDSVTKTILVVLADADATEKNIKMPDGKKNSVVEVTGADTPAVVVGGVDEIAEAENPSTGETVTVKLTVEKKEESAADKATEIKQVASGKTLDFLDLSLVKTVTPSSGGSTDTPITDTNGKVLEIVVPYDTSRQGVMVYRYHGGKVEKLTPANTGAGGTFKLDTASVIIYATKFSTYAIGYTPEGGGSSGGGGSSSGGGSSVTTYRITATAGAGGTISPSGRVSVLQNRSKTFTFTPGEGYVVADVLVDGKSVGAVTEYTFEKVTRSHTIEVSFKKADARPAWNPFEDVRAGDWFHDSVKYIYKQGLVEAADGRFEPHLNSSRAMITTILWKLEGGPEAKTAQPFPDVEDGQWYTEAITWAAEKGIVQGYGNGKFGPDDPITREQMVLILWHYAGRPETAGELTGFSDGDTVSSWVYPAMEWGIEQGIITGKTGNILDPKGKASRAEVATMLMRYCQLQK